MQKVRIVSASIEDAKLIAEQLRSRGFSVELATPGEPRLSEVDFEIELGMCGPEKALHQATDRVREKRAGDFDIPGIPLSSPTIADTVNGIAAGLQNKRDLMARALREERALLRQERAAQRERAQLAAKQNDLERADKEWTWREAESQRIAEEHKRIRSQEREEVIREQIVARERIDAAQGLRANRIENIPQVISPRTRQWRASFAIAGLCAVILTVGWAAAIRRPALPSARFGASKPVEQSASFAAQTQKPDLAAHKPRVLTGDETASRSPQPSNVPHKGTSHQQVVPLHRSTRERDHMIAEDEIVHIRPEYSRTAQQRPQAPQHASLRRYSDMQ